MKSHAPLLAFMAFAFLAGPAVAALPPANAPLVNFDNRNMPAIVASTLPVQPAAAVAGLRARVPNLKVDFEPVMGAPRQILNHDGFSSRPEGNGPGISAASLAAIPTNAPSRVTKAFLPEHSGLLGHGPDVLESVRVKHEFVTPHNGLRTVAWEQQLEGEPVFEALLISHAPKRYKLVNFSATATAFSLGTTNAIGCFTNQSSGIVQARTFNQSNVGRTLFEDFEPGTHLSLWSSFGGTPGSTVIATNYGGRISGINSLWFGDAGIRSATTIPINTSTGGSLSFYLCLGDGAAAPWETVDVPGEGVVLEYSKNNGASWATLGTYDTSAFYNWTQVTIRLPAGSLSPATQFRWRQLNHSGPCCDHWALDDISVDADPAPPELLLEPANQTVKPGSNVTFAVSAQGSPPLVYQWLKGGTRLSDGGRIAGATSAALTITTVVEGDSGQYSVVATNLYGSVTSSNAALLVTPLDHYNWSAIPSPQAVGVAFNATITAKDFWNATVTHFSGTVALDGSAGGGQATNTVLGNLVPSDTSFGDYTLGFAFTPNTNIVVTHVRSCSGTKISIWQTNGTLLASQNVSSVPGTWLETPLATPLALAAGSTYVVGFYTAAGAYYFRDDRTSTFPNGALVNAYYYTSADGFPETIVAGATVYLVDLRYTVNAGAPLLVTPASAGPFTNGVWTGSLTLHQPATNAVLRADNSSGDPGSSNPFDVLLQNDVSLVGVASPDPVSVGASLTYTLTVANAGPAAATSVVVTNFLPPGTTFVSAISSQGSCAQLAGVVTCDLGTVPAANNATISIAVVPNAGGLLTNGAIVSRAEAEPYAANNLATVITLAQPPAISVNDVSVLEGNVGPVSATFSVSLNSAAALPVSVNYATADGTAFAGSDYTSTGGRLIFAPGETKKPVVVVVNGDTTGESIETFFIHLTNPLNALLADAQGLGTILNEDVAPAVYLRSTVGTPWGSTANETAMDRVFGATNWQDLRYETANPGALLSPATTFIFMEGGDYNATELETFLTANMATLQNWVSNGGGLFLNAAPNEGDGMSFGFGVSLAYPDQTTTGVAAAPARAIFNGPVNPVGTNWSGSSFGHATISGTGLTTLITNTANGHIVLGEMSYGAGHVLFGGMTTDNFHKPQAEASNLRANLIAYLNTSSACHFEWDNIASPQELNTPFPVTITARDATKEILNGFTGPVSLNAIAGNSNPGTITPANSGNFTNGVWSGHVTVLQAATNVTLRADDGDGHVGVSNPFHVISSNQPPIIITPPTNAVAYLGGHATFQANVLGSEPLFYQWRFNGADISGATNFSYSIAGVQALNAGSYRALITNAFGVLTSSVANLTALAPIDAAVNAANLTWSTSGNAAWFGETTITHDGVDAAQSGVITDARQSGLQTTVAGPGVLSFWWKVASEQFFDYLNFYIDGVQQGGISGEMDWQSQTFPTGPGTHTLKWIYQKDSSVSAGLDAGWLDQVLYTTNPPVITLQPVGQTNSMGATFALTASASGAPPLTYQWVKAGTNIVSAISPVFNIYNATRHDSAVYTVVAKNPGGSTAASNAVVLIHVPQQLRTLLQPDGTCVLISADADGGLLLPGDLDGFEPQVSSNLLDWTALTNTLVLTHGMLWLADPGSANQPARFYRILEH